jgi:hypothetical protein
MFNGFDIWVASRFLVLCIFLLLRAFPYARTATHFCSFLGVSPKHHHANTHPHPCTHDALTQAGRRDCGYSAHELVTRAGLDSWLQSLRNGGSDDSIKTDDAEVIDRAREIIIRYARPLVLFLTCSLFPPQLTSSLLSCPRCHVSLFAARPASH